MHKKYALEVLGHYFSILTFFLFFNEKKSKNLKNPKKEVN